MATTTEALTDYERERGKPVPSWNHSMIQKNLIVTLARFEPEYTIASELTLDLADMPSNVTPDISIYGHKDTDYSHDEVRISEPPLVAVEIISPTQPTQEVVDKIRAMLGAGVRSCWLVQPAMQTISVYTADAPPKTVAEGTLTDPAVEGIAVDVADVFS